MKSHLPACLIMLMVVGLPLTCGGCGKREAEARGPTSSGSRSREPVVPARQVVEEYLRGINYAAVRLATTRAPMGFPEEPGMVYFEANGAYVGRRPQTLQIAVKQVGNSYRIVKVRAL